MKNKQYKKKRESGVIRIGDVYFTVDGEQYADYYAEIERRKYIKRLERGKKISYEKALEEGLPLELLSSNPPISVEEEAENNILIELMLDSIGQLSEAERSLIEQLYFDGLSLREWSKKSGVPLMTLHHKKELVLKKLKKMMGF